MEINKEKKISSIINRINKLEKKEKIHILNILKKYQTNYSKNLNGYFFNLGLLQNETIEKLLDCLDVIENNRDLIYEMDTKRTNLLNYYKNLIEEKIQLSIQNNKKIYTDLLTIKNVSNIYCNIKKIQENTSKNIDIDVLIKEYKKSQKYKKNSVFYRLTEQCKIIKLQNKQYNLSQKRENYADDFNYDNEIEDGDIEEYEEPQEFCEELENIDVENTELDNENNPEHILKKLELCNAKDIDIDEDKENKKCIKIEEENEVEEEPVKEYTENFLKTLADYKVLLSQHNYIFDEDSLCLLIPEDYISF